MSAVTIAGRLLAGGGRRSALDLGLSAAGVAVSVAITLLVLGGLHGLDARNTRTDWRSPLVSEPGSVRDPVALQQLTYERLGETTITVVRLAPLGDGAPLPPGVDRLPADGEVLASPSLQALLDGPGGDLLLPRLGDRVVGAVAADGVAHADEAFAVVGDTSLTPTPASEIPPYDHRVAGPFAPSPVVEVGGWQGAGGGDQADLYTQLFGFAGVLLVAPSILLLGAAARFTAARRAVRLAGLRLAGASPSQITRIAALESLAGAVAGVVLGIALAWAGRLVVAGIPLAGGPFGYGELAVPWSQIGLVAVVALVVAVIASLAGLRAVRVSPLGVVRPSGDRRPSLWRVVALGVVLTLFGAAGVVVGRGGEAVLLMVALALVIGSISVVGPWFTWLVGWATARTSRRPTTLLAARGMTSDPIGAFRPATPLVFTAFVGGFLLVVTGTTSLFTAADSSEATLVVPPGPAVADVRQVLDEAGVTADVAADDARARDVALAGEGGVQVFDPSQVDVEVRVDVRYPAQVEVARTALDPLVHPEVPRTAADAASAEVTVLEDIGRGVWLVVGLALVQAAAATGVGAAASVLERGQTLAALRLAGMEPRRMLAVRVVHAGLPVGVIAGISTALGAGAAAIVVVSSGPTGITAELGSVLGPPAIVVGAVAAAVLGAALSWPVLRDVTARPLADA